MNLNVMPQQWDKAAVCKKGQYRMAGNIGGNYIWRKYAVSKYWLAE